MNNRTDNLYSLIMVNGARKTGRALRSLDCDAVIFDRCDQRMFALYWTDLASAVLGFFGFINFLDIWNKLPFCMYFKVNNKYVRLEHQDPKMIRSGSYTLFAFWIL